MRIKTVKLYGFKSFGNKTTINFDSNLIGIVGPNGSGKSNLIDAIKWVFGEQKSKNLRTKANTDVIFMGSQNKKAMNFAEVSIFFDNSDYYLDIGSSEVEIKRRLYRSGENQYSINGSICRLKDINNLVLDKGFGKDSFSIISQGKVDEIIMSKPLKRREIIEEVAGILKYKYQKDIAQKKMEKVKINLEKIEFITNELENKLEPLQKAREKAIKYQKLAKTLKQKDINVLTLEIKQLSEELEDNKIQDIEFQKQGNSALNNIEKLELSKKEIDKQINIIQDEKNKLQNNINDNANEIMSLRNNINLIQERNLIYTKKEDVKNRIKFLNDKVTDLNRGVQKTKETLSKLTPKYEDTKRKIETLMYTHKHQKNEYYQDKRKFENLKEDQSKVYYPFAVTKILEAKINGVIDVVDKLYEVKKNYEVAIEIALGARKNEIVTVDDQVAIACVDYLKNKKYGRATFIPLNKIKSRYINEVDLKIINEDSLFLGKALDFLHFSKEYNNVFAALLGNIIICKNTNDAYKGLKKLKGNYQIITLDGEIISNNGKLTGGFNKKINKYQINSEINKLEEKINKFNNIDSKYNEELEALNLEKKELNLEITIAQNYINENSNDLNLYKKELNDLNKNENQNIISFENELSNLEENILKLKEQKTKLDLNEAKLEKEKEKQEEKLALINSEDRHRLQKMNENKIKIVELENKISINLDRLREEYEITYQVALKMISEKIDITKYKKDIQKIKSEIRTMGFINLDAIEEYSKEKEKFDYYKNQKDDLENSKNKILEIINKLDTFVIQQFEEAFIKVNREFTKIFQSLFEGGDAQLVLTNPSDLLETGVEIIAKPPGKKSQIIGLLSGGEKALCAISLLFAILTVRTIPYAILDEVEAALDEVNVSRYANYLQVFSQKTQFLVITHRQGTMEKLDKLYGITMPEKGISSVLETELKNKKKGDKNV